MLTIAGVEVLVLSLIIVVFGVWWLFKEEIKESEEGYQNSREFNHERFNPEIARRQADVSELYRLHPDWPHERIIEGMHAREEFRYLRALHPDWPSERIYEKIAAKKKAEESDSSETL
jgi:hypothetical protein